MNSFPKLSGLVAAVHTPFHPDQSLNLAGVEAQAAHLLEHRVKLAFVGGSTGECHSLSVDERQQLAERWLEAVRGTELQVVVHVGSNCLNDAAALAAHAQSHGALAIAALAPSYFKPKSVTDLIHCCAAIATAARETPFYFYDIPALTGVSLSMPEFLDRGRAAIPTLAGIKWSNPDLYAYQLCQHSAGAFDLPWGTDEYLLAALAMGATGAVGSTYCFAAPIYHRLLKAFVDDDLGAARREQFRSCQIVQKLAALGYMGAAKVVMKMVGVEVGPARWPNTNLTPEQTTQLQWDLEKLGFFEWVKL